MAGALDNWLGTGNVLPYDGQVIDISEYRGGLPWAQADFFPVNNSGDTFRVSMDNTTDLFLSVARCSVLASIIGKLSDAYANGRCEVLNRNTQNYVRGTYKEWERLMDKPNKLQSRTDFRKQLYAFVKINGWCYVQPEYSTGFNDRPSAIYIIPPWMMYVQPLEKNQTSLTTGKVRKLWFRWGGIEIPLDESKLILFKDTGTDIDRDTWLPKSRLLPLWKPISNIVAVEDAEHNLVTKRGGIGFISGEGGKDSFGHTAATAEDKTDLQKEFQRTNGLTGNRALFAITSAAMKWNQMAFNTKELMLLDIDRASADKICDGLGYPPFLLAHGKEGTFSNVGEAEKSLYQNTIIPNAQALDEQLNEGLQTPANNIEIRTDFTHIEALQQSEKEKGEARKVMNEAYQLEWLAGRITLNIWAVALGDDKQSGEQFDMYKPQYDKWLVDNGLRPDPNKKQEDGNNNNNPAKES